MRIKKKIYIDRNYLELYLERVHPEISSGENGLVSVGLEDITLTELILEGCELPSQFIDKETIV